MAPRRHLAEPRPTTPVPAARGVRRAGQLVVAAAVVAALPPLGGCAESRRATYEAILSGEIERADVDPNRFAAAFPERQTPAGAFAVAGADR